MWLEALKIAIITKDIDKIETLLLDLPELSKADDIDAALCLLKEATTLVTSLRDETQISMIQMKKNINYLNATNHKQIGKFDIKS
ncbi:hypothetical protein JHD49_07370 [Sulfurimonas sp. SAG-AH-194-C21]|nr:hypothetical protein [Sulfurimonas sp. SAG-AH-194-C21]MDF1883751.1 hypothetical protein [Sulfurimonas sp. SAG-AH-194-C21]